MQSPSKSTRTPIWLESLGDWSWPGTSAAAAAEILPPPWVPAFPPVIDAPVVSLPAVRPGRARARRRLWALALSLAALCALLALGGQRTAERALGIAPSEPAFIPGEADYATPERLPALRILSTDSAGSSIATTDYRSVALAGKGAFLTYLPPGYSADGQHYPVLYLLHGDDQPGSAFLQVGLQRQMDSLIGSHAIPPMIVVMVEGAEGGSNNWRAVGAQHYERYVVEVQELVDQMLPTVALREARAIAGDSMGGYGAMNIALSNPSRFGVVESWIGFFNGLSGALRADRKVIARRGLYAFLYGGAQDTIANPAEDPEFAEELTASGAEAQGLIYPGTHSLATVQEHLGPMLTFIGQHIAVPQRDSTRAQ